MMRELFVTLFMLLPGFWFPSMLLIAYATRNRFEGPFNSLPIFIPFLVAVFCVLPIHAVFWDNVFEEEATIVASVLTAYTVTHAFFLLSFFNSMLTKRSGNSDQRHLTITDQSLLTIQTLSAAFLLIFCLVYLGFSFKDGASRFDFLGFIVGGLFILLPMILASWHWLSILYKEARTRRNLRLSDQILNRTFNGFFRLDDDHDASLKEGNIVAFRKDTKDGVDSDASKQFVDEIEGALAHKHNEFFRDSEELFTTPFVIGQTLQSSKTGDPLARLTMYVELRRLLLREGMVNVVYLPESIFKHRAHVLKTRPPYLHELHRAMFGWI